jgi:hypothetical protein
MKAYTNQINVFKGGTAVVERKDKDQAAELKIAESFMLYRHQDTHEKHLPSLSTMMAGSRSLKANLRTRAQDFIPASKILYDYEGKVAASKECHALIEEKLPTPDWRLWQE